MSIPAATIINHIHGDYKAYKICAKDKSGNPIDLNGVTKIWFTVKKNKFDKDVDAIVRKTSDDPIEINITDALGGICYLYLIKTDTENLTLPENYEDYYYDFQFDFIGDKSVTPNVGIFRLWNDVTRGS